MHSDNQQVYCSITYILALAYADNAFESNEITSGLVLGLKVPKRLHTLPIPWKEEMKDVPIFRRMRRSASGIDVHPTLPMTYRTGNNALQRLGEVAGYRHSI